MRNLGLAYSAKGDVPEAIEYYEKALALDRTFGDRRGEGTDLGNLGNAYCYLGDYSDGPFWLGRT